MDMQVLDTRRDSKRYTTTEDNARLPTLPRAYERCDNTMSSPNARLAWNDGLVGIYFTAAGSIAKKNTFLEVVLWMSAHTSGRSQIVRQPQYHVLRRPRRVFC